MKNELLEQIKEQYAKEHRSTWDWEMLIRNKVPEFVEKCHNEVSERYAKEFAKEELEKNKFDATELWNKATKFESPLQTNGYWKALSDLERLGVIKMSEIEE